MLSYPQRSHKTTPLVKGFPADLISQFRGSDLKEISPELTWGWDILFY